MPRRKKVTASEMIVRGGFRSFRSALRYASRFGMAAEALGHAPNIKEYQDFHGISQAQAYKDWQAWRRCVPEYSVLEVVSAEALQARGLTEADREEAIANWLADV